MNYEKCLQELEDLRDRCDQVIASLQGVGHRWGECCCCTSPPLAAPTVDGIAFDCPEGDCVGGCAEGRCARRGERGA